MSTQRNMFDSSSNPISLATDTRDEAMRSLSVDACSSDFRKNDPLSLNQRQRQVYDVIRRNAWGISNAEIAMELGLEVNQITGRSYELRKLGLIVKGAKRNCRVHGRSTVQTWRVK